MERWSGKVAVVTGASGGIGGAVVRALIGKGLKVVALDSTPIDPQVAEELQDSPGKLLTVVTDLTNEEDDFSALNWIKENLEGVDILVNSAGVCNFQKLSDGVTSAWREMLDVNVLALSICTREAIKSMRERGVDDVHIVHISSTAGHYVYDREGLGMYTASKQAVTALAEGLRKELTHLNSGIRITNISPGAARTALAARALSEERFKSDPMLQPEDIAEAIMYALSAPPTVQVHEIMFRATGAPS